MKALLTHIFRKDYDSLRAALTRENVNSRDKGGMTLLMRAVLDDDDTPEMVKFLLSHGAEVDAHDTDQEWTALHLAARDQKAAIVRALLDGGSQVDSLDVFGNTPLWRAIADGGSNPVVVEMLLRAGADPRKKNSDGLSPIDVAIRLGKTELVDMMQKKRQPTSRSTESRLH